MKTETVSVTELTAKGLRPERGDNRAVVVVVDDDRVVADTMVAILQSNGFCAVATYRAETALEFVETVPPDLMIIDILLPGINGIELAMIMKAQCPGCRLLLVTADPGTEEMVEKARKQGHEFPVLMKPLYAGDLLFALADPDGASWRRQRSN